LTDRALKGNGIVFSDLKPTEVLAAAERLRPVVKRTPLIMSEALSEIAGGPVFLKLENRQTTGSFKLRGAFNVLSTLDRDARARGVVASSAGNHGLGVAYAAKQLGIAATIFIPATAARVKRDGIAALGATLDTSQPHYDAAMAAALKFAAERGATFVNPCSGERLYAGQGTIALEILSELPNLSTLVVSVGGGGLLAGCGSFVRAVSPATRIVGAQSENTAAMSLSLAEGRVVEIDNLPTIAEGLAGQIDDEGLEIGQRALDGIVTLTENEVARTIGWLWSEHGERVEGAGACGVGAVWLRKVGQMATPAAIIVSGGNIDDAKFEQMMTGDWRLGTDD
jgi:threonine dehydratase